MQSPQSVTFLDSRFVLISAGEQTLRPETDGAAFVPFRLTSDRQRLASAMRRFAKGELADGALDCAHSGDYPWAVASKLSPMCMLKTNAPGRRELCSERLEGVFNVKFLVPR